MANSNKNKHLINKCLSGTWDKDLSSTMQFEWHKQLYIYLRQRMTLTELASDKKELLTYAKCQVVKNVNILSHSVFCDNMGLLEISQHLTNMPNIKVACFLSHTV